jgi:hypothetical protein
MSVSTLPVESGLLRALSTTTPMEGSLRNTSSSYNGVFAPDLLESNLPRNYRLLFLNPGSAGPRRFDLPVSLALLRVMGKKVEAQLVELRMP